VFTDWQEALAVPAEAVLIATPPHTHAELAVAALDAGRHLYLEKPMATSADDAYAIARAAAVGGRVVQLGFAYRFHPLWRRVRARRQAGRLRTPLQAQARFFSEREGLGWSAPVIDLACHHLDLLSWVLGAPPAEVHAVGDGRLNARWADGSTLSGCYATGTPSDCVAFDDGRGAIRVDRTRGSRLRGPLARIGRDAVPDPGLIIRHRVDPGWEGAFESAIRAFGQAVRREASTVNGQGAGHRIAAGPLDGLYAVAAAEATLRSLRSGLPEAVSLAETSA
jgi:predicted dehydrogenase